MDHARLFADNTALYMWYKNLTTLVEEIKLNSLNTIQYTIINGTQSALNAVTCGLPQGSVLGPLFFAL